ncbi:hypothetical protein KKI23_02605 [Patescibacteria group bacterium]|nr:hypothetical protein [Patescibacteria group bacterium]
MKIYFFGPPTSKAKQTQAYETVLQLLKKAELEVFSNQEQTVLSEELSVIEQSGGMILDKMDAFIIEGSTPYQEIGYFLAYAISQKKPTLYLCDKSSQAKSVLKYLRTQKAPKFFQIATYGGKTLEKELINFLQFIKAGKIKEIASLKFTLRITPSIERYLHWKTHNTKNTKADFLREEIEKLIKNEDNYQKFLSKRE